MMKWAGPTNSRLRKRASGTPASLSSLPQADGFPEPVFQEEQHWHDDDCSSYCNGVPSEPFPASGVYGETTQSGGGAPWHKQTMNISTNSHFFETMSKRRRGYPSETKVKRGVRVVHGNKLLEEKLGRNDPCPCGSGKRFKKCCLEEGCF
jgi:hypothetical protein